MKEKFLEGKGAVITGGASGFGKGTALEFAEKGANLVLVDVNEEQLEQTVGEIEKKTGQTVVPITCDVSDPSQVKAMGKRAFKELENVYVVFNNAGVGGVYGKSLLRINENIWDNVMNINLKGQWLVAKALWRKMQKQDFQPLAGKMIHTASIAGMDPDPALPV